MNAELLVVEGDLAGARYPLQGDSMEIGRAPASAVVLTDNSCAWRHCTVVLKNGRHCLCDHRSGSGTFVNGLRAEQHLLEDGDHITIGETVLLYRMEASAPLPDTPRKTLLRACSLLFLVRGLDLTGENFAHHPLETQIIQLISDFVPCERGFVLLGRNEADLHARARERGKEERAAEIVARLSKEGCFVDSTSRLAAFPLYVRGAFVGVLAFWLHPGAMGSLAENRDTLSALATLASLGLENGRELAALRTRNVLLEEQLGVRGNSIIGESEPVCRLRQMIERVAPRDVTVLVLGESGTGKELVARAIHEQSTRRSNPFVATNCAALTDTLLESEMFGHEKGSFTGASAQKKGKLEMAEGGTVFLDEVGEMTPGLQAKLLRVLQQREFERVGGTRTIPLNVRIIAATNRDLAQEVKKGAFREDLYHRLNVVPIRTPPLRDRAADIPLLANHFLRQSAARCNSHVSSISPEAQGCLLRYSWPGNVRELENAIERAVVLGDGEMLMPEDLPEAVLDATPSVEGLGAYQGTVGGAKREVIQRAWRQSAGDYKAAAKILGIHPNSLLRLIRNLDMRDLLKE